VIKRLADFEERCNHSGKAFKRKFTTTDLACSSGSNATRPTSTLAEPRAA
jgi:hypothetical protein